MTVVRAADHDAIAHAARMLRDGGLVAFPTETVYGLGANALDAAAVQRIFDAKGRPSYNPIIVHVPDTAAARALAREWPPLAERLAAAFWPGPLTLVVPKREIVPDLVTAGRGSVAVRVPSHPVALALLRAAGVPIAAPSANRSGEVSPTSAAHVRKSLDGRVDIVLDGGSTDIGIESTVVDLSGDRPALLRPGAISAEDLERHVGTLGAAPAVFRPDAPRQSPGLLDRHYAPQAELQLVRSLEEARQVLSSRPTARPVGALVHSFPDLPADHIIRLPADAASYSHGLYAALHTFDDFGSALVIVEPIPDGIAWDGVRDRLTRAATPSNPKSGA